VIDYMRSIGAIEGAVVLEGHAEGIVRDIDGHETSNGMRRL
jgi:hypothetical protein